jgi:hypothetical protein
VVVVWQRAELEQQRHEEAERVHEREEDRQEDGRAKRLAKGGQSTRARRRVRNGGVEEARGRAGGPAGAERNGASELRGGRRAAKGPPPRGMAPTLSLQAAALASARGAQTPCPGMPRRRGAYGRTAPLAQVAPCARLRCLGLRTAVCVAVRTGAASHLILM